MTDDGAAGRGALAWLPPTLAPVALRLARADELEYQLGKIAFAWSAAGVLSIEQIPGDIANTVCAIVRAVRPVPPAAAMYFSEAIHHLRAALDNVVFGLVCIERGAALDDRAARAVELPIKQSPEDLAAWHSGIRKKVPELAAGTLLSGRIEALQPYRGGQHAVPSIPPGMALLQRVRPELAHPLTLLQGYSNADKHRAARLAVMRTLIQRSDEPFFTADLTLREVTVGDVLGTTELGRPVELVSNAALHIQRPDAGAWVGPGFELKAIHDWVAEVAIPTLILGTAGASPALPRSVELGDTGQLVADRIGQGGPVPAHTRLGEEVLRFAEQTPPDVQVLCTKPAAE